MSDITNLDDASAHYRLNHSAISAGGGVKAARTSLRGSRIAEYLRALDEDHRTALARDEAKRRAIEAGKIWDLDRERAISEDTGEETHSLMKAPTAKASGGSKGSKAPKKPAKPRVNPCGNCGEKQTVDIVVCQECGSELLPWGQKSIDPVERKSREILLDAEYDQLLSRSKINPAAILETLFLQPRFIADGIIPWAEYHRYWQGYDRDRDSNERGRPWRFGLVKAMTKRIYLRPSLVKRLEDHGIDMRRGRIENRKADLTTAFDMAMDLFTEAAGLIGRYIWDGIAPEDIRAVMHALQSNTLFDKLDAEVDKMLIKEKATRTAAVEGKIESPPF